MNKRLEVRIVLVLLLLLINLSLTGQRFNNGDFEGLPAKIKATPLGWRNVPISDIFCRASYSAGTTTDLLDEFGPQPLDGELGKPYSGKILVSGLYGSNHKLSKKLNFQEGIMQSVDDFSVGCEYEIVFYQSVVKQKNALDNSGSWSVFFDNDSMYTSLPTVSNSRFDNPNLKWEKRSFTFIAKSRKYLIKFLPQDDDPLFRGTTEFLRMGLDKLSIRKKNTNLNRDLLGSDRQLCENETLILRVSESGSSYLWQDGSTLNKLVVTEPGVYWVELITECGRVRDSVEVRYIYPPTLDLGDDQIICEGDEFTLQANNAGSSYLWQDGSTLSSYQITTSGIYWVEVANVCGVSRDTIVVQIRKTPIVDLGEDKILCEGISLTLEAFSPNTGYIWQDGSIQSNFIVTKSGTYWVELSNGCESIRDTVIIDFEPLPKVNLGKDVQLCQGETLELNVASEGVKYLWQDGTTSSEYMIDQEGTYWIKVSNDCGSTVDSLKVDYIEKPLVELGNDTILCDDEGLWLEIKETEGSILWQDDSEQLDYFVDKDGWYWAKVKNNCGESIDSIWIDHKKTPVINLGEDRVLCEDEELTLDANFKDVNHLWQDNTTDNIMKVSDQGEYWVTLSNECGIASDSIIILYENCHCMVYIPNSFSPNNDGINDDIVPMSDCEFAEYSFQVFNRWGELIFYSERGDEKWDGKLNNKLASQGVYAYIFKYGRNSSNVKLISGSITLMR